MQSYKTLVVLTAAGLLAPVVAADPSGLPSMSEQARPLDSIRSVQDYIAGLAGPSQFAPRATAPASGLGGSTLFMMAGPSNMAGDPGPKISVPAGGFGDSPDVLGVLATDMVAGPRPMPSAATARVVPDAGSYQVAVPLPGAGALAAGGLAFVAIRRRRR